MNDLNKVSASQPPVDYSDGYHSSNHLSVDAQKGTSTIDWLLSCLRWRKIEKKPSIQPFRASTGSHEFSDKNRELTNNQNIIKKVEVAPSSKSSKKLHLTPPKLGASIEALKKLVEDTQYQESYGRLGLILDQLTLVDVKAQGAQLIVDQCIKDFPEEKRSNEQKEIICKMERYLDEAQEKAKEADVLAAEIINPGPGIDINSCYKRGDRYLMDATDASERILELQKKLSLTPPTLGNSIEAPKKLVEDPQYQESYGRLGLILDQLTLVNVKAQRAQLIVDQCIKDFPEEKRSNEQKEIICKMERYLDEAQGKKEDANLLAAEIINPGSGIDINSCYKTSDRYLIDATHAFKMILELQNNLKNNTP